MNILFLFLDGCGLGNANPDINPFTRAHMPNLTQLIMGEKLTADLPLPLVVERTTLLALDACLGVGGLPQSATGQAALLTGMNIPARLGYHYGPKPNQEIAKYLNDHNLFRCLQVTGCHTSLLNAYPSGYFDGIKRGYRLPGAVAMAAYQAGVRLMTAEDLQHGNAISADITGQGWRDHLGYRDTPILTPHESGKKLVDISTQYNFSFFEYWLTDIAGHQQDMNLACTFLECIDQFLGGLLLNWNDDTGLIIISSDHGNLEDMSTRRHTVNQVPLILIGAQSLRQNFIEYMSNDYFGGYNLTQVMPAILNLINTYN